MDRLENFVGGARVAPKSGEYVELVNPSTGEPFVESPVSGADDVDHALRDGARGLPDVAAHDAVGALARAAQQIADAIEARADELVAIESENTGKPIALTLERGDPADGRPDPVLRRRAARLFEGRGAAEYMAGHTSLRAARADRRVRGGHAVELPDDDGGVEVGARARRRQHDGAEARATRRRPRRCSWPSSWPSSCRRASSTSSAATATPVGCSSSTTMPADGVGHRLGARRQGGRGVRASPTLEEGPPRARRQGAGHRLRRRRPRRRPPRPSRSPATSTPARTAPPRRACSRGPKVYGDFVDALAEQARGTVTGPPDNEDALFGPVNNVEPARARDRLPRPSPGARDASRPAARGSATAATSSSRRSSRACTRTTR